MCDILFLYILVIDGVVYYFMEEILLKGLKFLFVIKKVRGGRLEGLKEFVCMFKEKKIDVLELDEIENIVNLLIGENMIELLELVGRG